MRGTTGTTAALAVLLVVGCASPETRPTASPKQTGTVASRSLADVASPSASPEQDPRSAGVAVDVEPCSDRTLALPTGPPTDGEAALVQARLRCDVLADPPPEDRCDRGGDAQWHVRDAWLDDTLAPFPEAVTEADAGIEAGTPEWARPTRHGLGPVGPRTPS